MATVHAAATRPTANNLGYLCPAERRVGATGAGAYRRVTTGLIVPEPGRVTLSVLVPPVERRRRRSAGHSRPPRLPEARG